MRFRKDGKLEFIGRSDGQIKIHGYRIELSEIESVIREFDGVSDVPAQAFSDNSGEKYIAAYVIWNGKADEDALREHIAASKPAYMVPAVFMQIDRIWVRMDAMPRNANGKIIRAQLPQSESCVCEPGTVFSEAGARVVEATAAVLGIRHYISPDNGFAELCGTSLKAMELASALLAIGIRVGSPQILKLNTLRAIAAEAQIDYRRFWTDEEYRLIRKDFASRGEQIEKVLPITPEQDELPFCL